LTRDPRDPSVNWPVTRVTRDPWPATPHESWLPTIAVFSAMGETGEWAYST